MTFQPGHNLSNGRPQGSANRRSEQLRIRLKDRGDVDPADFCSSIVSNKNESTELKLQAASFLLPYLYPKRGSVPPPRYVEEGFDVPEFTHLSDAESFLARIAALTARGELDIQTALELSTLAKNWIDAQYAKEELAIKQISAGTSEHEQQVIRVEGMLQQLPGTNIIGFEKYPTINDHAATNGHALEPPVPQLESSSNDSVLPAANDSVQQNPSTNGQGSPSQDGEPA
jgi:hypothetical protein